MLQTKEFSSEVAVRRLRHCPLFDGMSDGRLAEIAGLCSWQYLDTGQIAAGGSHDTFFIVCHGHMRVWALVPNGRELLISDFSQGDHFGVVGVTGVSAASLQAQALAPSVLACLTRSTIAKLAKEDSVLGGFLMEAQQATAEQLISRLIELGTFRISERLYSYLLELAEKAGIDDGRSVISPSPRHAQIAARIAASREEVSREMARLRKQALIASSRKDLTLLDVGELVRRLRTS